ncbi:excisionase [Chitinimonas arctica]|uniref:Excisionase n=1 Tax=Chitinimonas arctica TaxID=2594795 RepID=A0A516SAU5_9NEIS|nr:excisionase [Chitinimonas arctica]
MLRFVTVERFAELSGYTPHAIRAKISRGIWRHGDVVIKAPDNRILIDVQRYEEWVLSATQLGQLRSNTPSQSPLPLREPAQRPVVGASPPPLGARKTSKGLRG